MLLLYTLTLNSPNGLAINSNANIINPVPTCSLFRLIKSTVIYSIEIIVKVISANKPMPIPKCFNVSIITPTVVASQLYITSRLL